MILNFLYAEYVFFERFGDDIKGIDNPIILELVKQYEWPNNINSEISDAEKEASISNEEAFIRSKLKEINPNYDLHFIPTILMQKVAKDQERDIGETVGKLRREDPSWDNADRFIDQELIALNPKMVEFLKDYIFSQRIPESLSLSEVEKKVVSVEEEAHRNQEFLLYRATRPIVLQPKSELSPPMYVLDYPGKMGYEEAQRPLQERSLYHLRKMRSYGLSFNSTYFSGCKFDSGACTPDLMGALYVLKIPKKEFETYLNNLIYMPNYKIHYLSELFKPKSEFHPRTKGKGSSGMPPEGVSKIEYDKVRIAQDIPLVVLDTIQKKFEEGVKNNINAFVELREILTRYRKEGREIKYTDVPDIIREIEAKGIIASYGLLAILCGSEEDHEKFRQIIRKDYDFNRDLRRNTFRFEKENISWEDIVGILCAFVYPEKIQEAINDQLQLIEEEHRLMMPYHPDLLFQLAVADMLAKYMVVLYDGQKIVENNDTDLIENQQKVVGFIRSKFMFEPTLHKIEQYAGKEPSEIRAAEQALRGKVVRGPQ